MVSLVTVLVTVVEANNLCIWSRTVLVVGHGHRRLDTKMSEKINAVVIEKDFKNSPRALWFLDHNYFMHVSTLSKQVLQVVQVQDCTRVQYST
jgi:hypothetical protein